MIQSSQHSAPKAKSTETDTNVLASAGIRPGQPVATDAQAATKDAGRVHIGGGMMHF